MCIRDRSETWEDNPLFVDLEGDGFGEIILVNNANGTLRPPSVVVLSAKQKEDWTPTASVWTDWNFSFQEGIEEGFGNKGLSPNWTLPWKDKNFFRGAINSCWICYGTLDPFFDSLEHECVAQQWVISGQLILNTTSTPSITLDPSSNITIQSDFILANGTSLNIVVSEQGETGTLNINGSFIQDGIINVDLRKVDLTTTPTLVLQNIINVGNHSGSVVINLDTIELITDKSIDPCFVQVSQIDEQRSVSLLVSYNSKVSNKCNLSDDSENLGSDGLVIGLTVGLVGGCFCIVLVGIVALVLLLTMQRKSQGKTFSTA
eukprot:TRINITY_DN4346_c0_g1_i1.p1 TRINITY_DN4346_c0_g1~~TRINITY_DN4346_c0_g1_i1.p1  ORF type:complete len:318 (+),score=53.71 TRINITY_DN4346_c0_g1_i1:32-985(+)